MRAPTCVAVVIALAAPGVSAQRSHLLTNAHIDISWGSQAQEAMPGKGAVLVTFMASVAKCLIQHGGREKAVILAYSPRGHRPPW